MTASAGLVLAEPAKSKIAQYLLGIEPVQIDEFYRSIDGEDHAPALIRAFAFARDAGRPIAATPAARYRLLQPVEIWPEVDGKIPDFDGASAEFILGSTDTSVNNDACGFRIRGRKSGAASNPVAGVWHDLVINANHVQSPNGVRGIFIENGGGDLLFRNIHGKNYIQGYHIQNFRYADGGSTNGGLNIRDCFVKGARGGARPTPRWYAISDAGDLSVAMPSDLIASGTSVVISTVQNGSTGGAVPKAATACYWKNSTTRPIAVPSDLSAASLSKAGFDQGASNIEVNGVLTPAIVADYYLSGGKRKANCVVPAEKGEIDNVRIDGGYYGAYLSGCEQYKITKYHSINAVRGIACEWGAKNISLVGANIENTLSTAILFGYNCPNGFIDKITITESNDRWIGEALINVQLSSPKFRIARTSITTGNRQISGQYHIKISVDCSDFEIVGPVVLSGDCAKAYICVESAWNSELSKGHIEHYPQSRFYSGAASNDMTGGLISNVLIHANSVKKEVPTVLCLMQVKDSAHGEIALGPVHIENIRVDSSKHKKYLKLVEGSDPAKRIDNCSLKNCAFPHKRDMFELNSKMQLPRKQAHFERIISVTNLDNLSR